MVRLYRAATVSIGTLGLVVGILGQLIGLFSAFSHLGTVESISTEMLAGGLKVSLITTLLRPADLHHSPRLRYGTEEMAARSLKEQQEGTS